MARIGNYSLICSVLFIILFLVPVSCSSSPSSPLVHFHSRSSRHLLSSENSTAAEPCVPEHENLSTADVIIYIIGSAICVLMGAVMSGLQVGYFSLDPMKLALLQMDTAANPRNKSRAKMLAPLLAQHHWLLVTLLICNAAAMETLPIMLDALVPPYIAIILSVTFVLFFGEVIPQALCTKEPLKFGAFFAPFIRFLMFITAPLGLPVAKLLDYILGHEGGAHFLLAKTELNALVELHSSSAGGHLIPEEVRIMKGALSFSEKHADSIMTPLKTIYMVEIQRLLDFQLLQEIFHSGYSRIPVYNQMLPSTDNIVGLLIAKDLLLIDPLEGITVGQILQYYPHSLEKVFPDQTLVELLGIMKTGRSHMALVHEIRSDGPGDPYRMNLGIITLEDVIEAILQTEIEDETDQWDQQQVENGNNTGNLDSLIKSGRNELIQRFQRRRLPDRLTPQEFSALQLFFQTKEVEVFNSLSGVALKRLLNSSRLENVRIHEKSKEKTYENAPIEAGGRFLYQQGVESEYISVIIEGSVAIRASLEEFSTEMKSWGILARSAIAALHKENFLETFNWQKNLPTFKPDFTAFVTGSARILRISRKDFIREWRRDRGLEEIPQSRPEPVEKKNSFSANRAAPNNDSVLSFKNTAGSTIELTKSIELTTVERALTRNAVLVELLEGEYSEPERKADAP